MKTIDLERWKPSENDPRKLKYAGQPTAEEVFQELKHRLESIGYLPDEYFLLDSRWENGREIPRGADVTCQVDYGGSEGIYLDIALTWHDEKEKQTIIKKFITGKTLGESGDDLDRMYLIAAAVTKAFHGDHITPARYMMLGVPADSGGCVIHLSQQERQTVIEALMEQRERQENAMSQAEQLLRRMTGSITAYMDTVGQRPLHLSDYDKAVLAIRDGDLNAFRDLWPKVQDHADALLVEAAHRPGMVGRQITSFVLWADDRRFSQETYRTVVQKAIDIDDPVKVKFLLEQSESQADGLPLSFQGEMASYAYLEHRFIAKEIIKRCTSEQIAAAPPVLLVNAVRIDDIPTARDLAAGGISADTCFADIAELCAAKDKPQMASDLLRQGAQVSSSNFGALHACIGHGCLEAGKLLLDQGMDLEQYKDWAVRQNHGLWKNDVLNALEEHWRESKGSKN